MGLNMKNKAILTVSKFFLIVSIMMIVLALLNLTFLSDFMNKNTINTKELASAIFVNGLTILFLSFLIRSLHTGILLMGRSWLGGDIYREKSPIVYWIVFSIATAITFFFFFASLMRIINSLNFIS